MASGLEENDFWHSTPRQVSRRLKGLTSQRRREHNDRAWLAYYTALLPRSKRHIPLRKLQFQDRAPQSPDQMLAVAKQWTVLLGGEVTGKPN